MKTEMNFVKKMIALLLAAAMLAAFGAVCAGAETVTAAAAAVTTPDGLVSIQLPNRSWYQLVTGEHTELFSDGDCAIMIDLYNAGDKLPAIETADNNHELIYTAAVSTQKYVMVVIGYAHERSDFSGIVKAINTIELNTDKISDDSTDHAIVITDYTIRDTWYTAWVSASLLNVRAGFGTDTVILTALPKDTRLTVTGTVLKNGAEIGWSRVTLQNGTQGYVSTQFLTTSEPRPSGSDRTGEVMTLYTANGTPTLLYRYTDGSWQTAGGVKYWMTASGNYTSVFNDTLYVKDPTAGTWRTGVSKTLYRSNGSVVYIYEYNNGAWMDDCRNTYTLYNIGQWQCSTGEILTLEPLVPQTPTATGETIAVYSVYGQLYFLYHYTDGTWRLDGVIYEQRTNNTWYGDNGDILYTNDPAL